MRSTLSIAIILTIILTALTALGLATSHNPTTVSEQSNLSQNNLNFNSPSQSQARISIRHDLYDLIQPKICAHSPANAQVMIQIKQLIATHSFDAGAKLISTRLNTASQAMKRLQKHAIQTAHQEHHRGGVWGVCEHKHRHLSSSSWPRTPIYGWIMTTPSPYPVNDPQLFSALKTHCNRLEILALKSSLSPSLRPIPPQTYLTEMNYHTWQQVMTQDSLKNTAIQAISLRCFPNQPSWLGPVMWFLRQSQDYQHKLSQAFRHPTSTPLTTTAYVTTLNQLINQTRAQQGLPHLKTPPSAFKASLKHIAQQLATHHGLTHHHQHLEQISVSLKNNWGNIYSIGSLSELRTMATSPAQAMTQLLGSPSHYDALMHPQGGWIVHDVKFHKSSATPPLVVTVIVQRATKDAFIHQ